MGEAVGFHDMCGISLLTGCYDQKTSVLEGFRFAIRQCSGI